MVSGNRIFPVRLAQPHAPEDFFGPDCRSSSSRPAPVVSILKPRRKGTVRLIGIRGVVVTIQANMVVATTRPKVFVDQIDLNKLSSSSLEIVFVIKYQRPDTTIFCKEYALYGQLYYGPDVGK